MRSVDPFVALLGAVGATGVWAVRNSAGAPPGELLVYLAGIVVALGIGAWGLLGRGARKESRRFGPGRVGRLVMASLGAAFGVLILGALIVLPFAGAESFLVVAGPYSGVIWLVLAIALAPLIEPRLE